MEYQYYEFQAIDRPLNNDEQDYISSLSRRVQLTPRQAIFTYSYGDFRGDPLAVLARYFDALFYQANWGTTQLAFRFPSAAIDPRHIEPYCVEDSIEIIPHDAYTILNITITDENQVGWIQPEGILGGLLPLRDAILNGDLRVLYIAWLKAAGQYVPSDSDDEDVFDPEDAEDFLLFEEEDDIDLSNAPEPPVLPNLQSLSVPLERFIEAFSVDTDLVGFAAEGSAVQTAPADRFAQWVPLLPEDERTTFLVRLAEGDPNVRMELGRRLREVGGAAAEPVPDATNRRTFQALRAGASGYAQQRKAREQQAAAEKRQRELDALARREDAAWEEVFALIEQKNASGYDQATKLLTDLHDLAVRQQQAAIFHQRLDSITSTYANRTALLRRLRDARLA